MNDCIIGSRSTAGPPMLPNYHNNFKRIVQTEDHVMILTEMNHDVRIVRMNAEHPLTGCANLVGRLCGSLGGRHVSRADQKLWYYAAVVRLR